MSNEITYGTRVFDDDDIVDGNIYEAVSPLADALEIGTFGAEVVTDDPVEQAELIGFTQNQPLVYRKNGKQLGIWYVKNVERTSKITFAIRAENAYGLLEQGKHYGGIYTGQTVGEVVADICTVPYTITDNVAKIKLYGWLPIASRRANLAQVLFAAGAWCKIDQAGVIHIGYLWSGVSNRIDPDHVFVGDKVKYESKVSAVSVLEHSYVQGAEDIKVFDGTATQGDIVEFREPVHTLVASGVTILDRGANWCKLSGGTGTVTGKKYAHTTRAVVKHVSDAPVENVIEVKQATLVSLVNAVGVAQRLADYYKHGETIQADVVYGVEAAGDVVSIEHPYGGEALGMVKSTDIQIDDAPVAEEKIVNGYLPPSTQDIVYYDRRVIFTSSQDYPKPAGVKSAHAVIISGGDGGQGGTPGTAGGQGGSTRLPNGSNGTYTGAKAGPGKGGLKGAAGLGGRISIVDIDVSDVDVIHIAVGKGGTGGTAGAAGAEAGNAGTRGQASTVTVGGKVYSSDAGTSSDAGYTDTTTGEQYAIPGEVGIDGGGGGKPGDLNNPGEAGGPVGQWPGGAGNEMGRIKIDSSVTGPWVFDHYTQSEQRTSRKTLFSGTYTGYTQYKISDTGTIATAGYENKIGMIGGKVVPGTIYYNQANGSVDGAATTSSIRYRTVEENGLPDQFILEEGVITTNRYYVRGKAYYACGSLPAGGGGAAHGAAGSPATEYQQGGPGANAVASAKPTQPGAGGHGGHGGGAGGAGGSAYIECEDNDKNIDFGYTYPGMAGGAAGAAAPGTDGADGCVILYYGEPKIIKTGAGMDSAGNILLDGTGRLLIM